METTPSELYARIDVARSRGLSIEQTERTRLGWNQWTLTVPGQFAVAGLLDGQLAERLDHPHRFDAGLGLLSERWITAVHQAGHGFAMLRYDLDSLNYVAAYGPIAHTEVMFRDFSPTLIAAMTPRPHGGAWVDLLEQVIGDPRSTGHGDAETADRLLTDPDYVIDIRDDVQRNWSGLCGLAEHFLAGSTPDARQAVAILRDGAVPIQRGRIA